MNAATSAGSWIARRPARWSMPVCLQPRAPRRCRIVRAEDKRPVRHSRLGCHLQPHGHYQLEITGEGESDEPRSVSLVAGPLRRANDQEQRLTPRRPDDHPLRPAVRPRRRRGAAAELLVVAAGALGRPAGVRRWPRRLRAHAVAGRHAPPRVGALGPDQLRRPVRLRALAFPADPGRRQLVGRLVPNAARTRASRRLARADAGDLRPVARHFPQRPPSALAQRKPPPPRDPPRSATLPRPGRSSVNRFTSGCLTSPGLVALAGADPSLLCPPGIRFFRRPCCLCPHHSVRLSVVSAGYRPSLLEVA